MSSQNFTELTHFLLVAQYQSFVKAGDKLGISSSAISHSVKRLEDRLGVRLFNRTTRSVTLTEVGSKLYADLTPLFKSIDERVDSITEFLDEPRGTIRMNVSTIDAETIVYPRLKQLLLDYPKINLELSIDDSFVDIVSESQDMGIRFGNDVGENFIVVQVSPPTRFGLFASTEYLKKYGTPKIVEDLAQHQTIGMKLANNRSETPWEFQIGNERKLYTPKSHFLTLPNLTLIKQAVLDGLGITLALPESFEKEIAEGKVAEVLKKYSITYEPRYLYYSSRKGNTTAFKMVVDALRYKES
ncbi:hypothetical protein CKF54_07250 [Psittacicella hinzii]|uniref:HTH lysR-type domain-containing protein n=1 Tax=Psittacicella hinzii TaxID=2028575 RepID=A0A3A1XYT8_9GAMM|nr:LysR substrate-binding domain-containing protein [Psittacicella hinzii]RIY31192.1 hypothetical protein CKF54_07250 [Psittacicella hinzii]